VPDSMHPHDPPSLDPTTVRSSGLPRAAASANETDKSAVGPHSSESSPALSESSGSDTLGSDAIVSSAADGSSIQSNPSGRSYRSGFRLTPREYERFERAIAGIDAINSSDPNWISIEERERPRELALSELVSRWVSLLRPHASLELRLAARAHHIRRWAVQRSSFPAGNPGYVRWRNRLQQFHAEQTGILLAGEGYPEDTILRVQALVRQRGLEHDPEAQVLQDAICLTFFETQLESLAEKTADEKLTEILRRTIAKMSPRALEFANSLRVGTRSRTLLTKVRQELR